MVRIGRQCDMLLALQCRPSITDTLESLVFATYTAFVAESMWTLNSAPAGRGMVAGVWRHPEVSPAWQCRVLISDMAPGVNEDMVSVTYAVLVAWSTVIATG